MSEPESVSFITQMLEACERIREKYMIGQPDGDDRNVQVAVQASDHEVGSIDSAQLAVQNPSARGRTH